MLRNDLFPPFTYFMEGLHLVEENLVHLAARDQAVADLDGDGERGVQVMAKNALRREDNPVQMQRRYSDLYADWSGIR